MEELKEALKEISKDLAEIKTTQAVMQVDNNIQSKLISEF